MRTFEINITEEQEEFILDFMNYFEIETEQEVVQLMLEGCIFSMSNYRKFLYNFFRDRKEMLVSLTKDKNSISQGIQKEIDFVNKFKSYIEG